MNVIGDTNMEMYFRQCLSWHYAIFCWLHASERCTTYFKFVSTISYKLGDDYRYTPKSIESIDW